MNADGRLMEVENDSHALDNHLQLVKFLSRIFLKCSNIRGRFSKDPSPIQPILNDFSGWTLSAAREAGCMQKGDRRG